MITHGITALALIFVREPCESPAQPIVTVCWHHCTPERLCCCQLPRRSLSRVSIILRSSAVAPSWAVNSLRDRSRAVRTPPPLNPSMVRVGNRMDAERLFSPAWLESEVAGLRERWKLTRQLPAHAFVTITRGAAAPLAQTAETTAACRWIDGRSNCRHHGTPGSSRPSVPDVANLGPGALGPLALSCSPRAPLLAATPLARSCVSWRPRADNRLSHRAFVLCLMLAGPSAARTLALGYRGRTIDCAPCVHR